ncbi:XdhC family protein [Actinoplanes sp. NPDC051494]|uniref:XdhC family protein n=1 Tax=Actinoplanes sp. NPDC051494 TaxID=3363907 RepID=UPI0037ADC2D1
MREVLDDLLGWWRGGDGAAALATVVRTSGGSPRPIGSAMAVGPDASAVGGISGGCVESAVYDLARETAADGRPRTGTFDANPDDVFAVSRPCGGRLDVFVERVNSTTFPELPLLAATVAERVPVSVVTCVGAPDELLGRHLLVTADGVVGGRIPGALRIALARRAGELLRTETSATVTVDGRDFFIASWAPSPRLVVLGSAHGAAALAELGRFMGRHVTVCDPRPLFATAKRFPGAHEVVVGWPDDYLRAEADAGRLGPRDAVCVLTHEARTAVPALLVALHLPLAYLGVMGSRRSQEQLRRDLLAEGADPAVLDRMAAPIGLDLGATDSAETAVSIGAELIAAVRGGSAQPLHTVRGAIHRTVPDGPVRTVTQPTPGIGRVISGRS